ncbi:thioredoxin family protein [Streptomyces echinatus]|nr:thioredoxin domain-containing protein [Streptomyces echinatus]
MIAQKDQFSPHSSACSQLADGVCADGGIAMKAVTDAGFETAVLKSDKPVLVQYWAQWSDPSRTFSPVVQEIAAEQADKLVTLKMNVDTTL